MSDLCDVDDTDAAYKCIVSWQEVDREARVRLSENETGVLNVLLGRAWRLAITIRERHEGRIGEATSHATNC